MAGSQQQHLSDEATLKKTARSEGKTDQGSLTIREQLIAYVLRHRGVVLFGAIVLVVVMELVEHLIILDFGEGVHTIYDLALYALLVPTSVWLVLSVLESTDKERKQFSRDNNLRTEFSQNLGNARSWDELLQATIEYLHQVAPSANTTLFIATPKSSHMRPEAACDRGGRITLHPKISISPDSLPIGSLPQLLVQNGSGGSTPPIFTTSAGEPLSVNDSMDRSMPQVILPPNRYDLPVTRNDQQIGVIKLEYLPGISPTVKEIQTLKSAAPVIALAMEGAMLQNLAIEQAAASESQRQQIAQNLHDTLAQNISYLRLKLDQLTGGNAIREIGVVLQELERMRTTADEAYQQVRNTLDELDPVRAEDVVTTVVKHARAISQRSGINLRTSQMGTPYSLPPAARQQIIYIAREALHNIEKHACARQVQVQVLWLETELILKITDDGIGFNPLAISADGHYGLWIMQHRAQEIGGTLKISRADQQDASAPGTEVTLWVPRPTYPTGQPE